MAVTVGLVDNYPASVQAFAEMVNDCNDFHVTLLAYNGKDLLDQLSYLEQLPEILIMGIGFPLTDEPGTAEMLKSKYPGIKTIALCMEEDQQTLVRMIKLGCRGWLTKLTAGDYLEDALLEVHKTGYYNADKADLDLGQLVRLSLNRNRTIKLNDEERLYLEFACSELSSEEIADKMNVSKRAVHKYFSRLCYKLFATSRAGLALETARRNLVLSVQVSDIK